ncbi:hypothetical protein BDY19DRAFT_279075 [Irpex rosettiformis]|uniref:Uncharacterized protein n=1 Tax=Irpex rosettiformis TaxID=378272 RepID=A0ACB8UI44_9APHY|nr:hypothetical protein BDY19DRAFT_279075 [Irpex rosettiformis]
MQLFTILSSFIIFANARPVPQTVSIATTDSTSLNSTTTIGVQDALNLLSAGTAASVSVLASAYPSVVIPTATAPAASTTVADSGNAGNTFLPSTSLDSSDSLPTAAVLSSDLPSHTSLAGGGSNSNSTDAFTADLPSISVLPTTSLENGTGTTTAVLSTGTTTNTPIIYRIPTDIPQACISKDASKLSASGITTASVAGSTAISPVSPEPSSSSVATTVVTLTASSSLPTLSTPAADSSQTDTAFSNAAATASASSTSDPLISSDVFASPIAPSVSADASASGALSLPATSASAAATSPAVVPGPLQLVKRIAQDDLPDVAQSWQDLCLASGGDIFTNEPCVTLAGVNGINALLADADPCDQQDNADAMIDFAKSTGVTNSADLIANAIAYRQHARNAFSVNGVIPSTPYCQKTSKNSELKGIVNAQLPGVSPGVYGGPSFGLVAFGDPASCPFGTTPEADNCSCS